jgi:hypothetical protein
LNDVLARRGQFFQVNAGAFVGAVLAPHHGEDAFLGVGGLALQNLDDALVFFGSEHQAGICM